MNWRESPSHIRLLKAFEKPRDPRDVFDWQWPRYELREETEAAIDRFVREGMLVPASVPEALGSVMQVAQLKKLLTDRNLPSTGRKPELIERLVVHDPEAMRSLVGAKLMTCSDAALKFLDEQQREVELASAEAERLTLQAFEANDPREACRIHEALHKRYIDWRSHSGRYDIKKYQLMLTAHPRILAELSPTNLHAVQIAACMKDLWPTFHPERWLPPSFSSSFKNNEVPVNYLIRHAEIQTSVTDYSRFSKQVKVKFNTGDLDSCSLCLRLNEQVLDIETFPDLPIPGCTSDTGCKCLITLPTTGLLPFNFDESEDLLVEDPPREGSVDALRALKKMLDEGLITESEYDEKKKEILSRL